jgi:Ankyrin repeats (many copies)
MHACCSGNVQVVKLLLEAGVNMNTTDKLERTPLMYALWYGNLQVAKLLLEAGANAHTTDKRGRTPLHVIDHRDMRYTAQQYCDMIKLLWVRGCPEPIEPDSKVRLYITSTLRPRLRVACLWMRAQKLPNDLIRLLMGCI